MPMGRCSQMPTDAYNHIALMIEQLDQLERLAEATRARRGACRGDSCIPTSSSTSVGLESRRKTPKARANGREGQSVQSGRSLPGRQASEFNHSNAEMRSGRGRRFSWPFQCWTREPSCARWFCIARLFES